MIAVNNNKNDRELSFERITRYLKGRHTLLELVTGTRIDLEERSSLLIPGDDAGIYLMMN